MKRTASLLVLGVHPFSRGFGWVMCEGPHSLFDWGGVEIEKGDKHTESLARLGKLVDRYEPSVLAFEDCAAKPVTRAKRIVILSEAMIALGRERDCDVVVYSLATIRGAFRDTGARTRRQIAQAVANRLPDLRHRLPPPQKLWVGEHPNMALFAAAALALTHFAVQ